MEQEGFSKGCIVEIKGRFIQPGPCFQWWGSFLDVEHPGDEQVEPGKAAELLFLMVRTIDAVTAPSLKKKKEEDLISMFKNVVYDVRVILLEGASDEGSLWSQSHGPGQQQ